MLKVISERGRTISDMFFWRKCTPIGGVSGSEVLKVLSFFGSLLYRLEFKEKMSLETNFNDVLNQRGEQKKLQVYM